MKKIILIALVMTMSVILFAERITIESGRNDINVISSSNNRTVIDYKVTNFNTKNVEIDGQKFQKLKLEGFANTFEKGNPELPKISRSIIIPNMAKMDVEVISSEYVDYKMNIVPSKGIIYRNQDIEAVPYEFGSVYKQNQFYPQNVATLGKPYIMRDYRGVVVNVYPFQFNPVTHTLRVYTDVRIAVNNVGMGTENLKFRNSGSELAMFSRLYENHFLNHANTRYDELDDEGKIVVIAADAYADEMQPFVDWKIQKGIPTDIYTMTEVGSSAANIQTFIEDLYETEDNLAFVQLVGDSDTVPTLYNDGDSDPSFALLEGNDSYPEIFIGRFSAQSANDVTTQVDRIITYERDITEGEWLSKAFGLGSSQGAGQGDDGESDPVHLNNIKADLIEFTYTYVDEIYDGAQGGIDEPSSPSASTVAAVLNEGRGFANYCGHGSTTSWSSSGFSNSDINNLTNTNMLPHIVSVACVNGNFVGNTCFAEAWMRATDNNGDPTGAVTIYASTINQSWAPPMSAQDEITDLLVAESKNTIGGLYYSGSCLMIDEYGSAGEEMYHTWHIFGDPSLQVRSAEPTAFVIPDEINMLVGMSEVSFNIGEADARVSVTANGEILSSTISDSNGDVMITFPEPVASVGDLNVTITGFNKVTTETVISVIPAEGPYIVVDNFSVIDGNNNTIEYAETIDMNLTFGNVGVQTAASCSAEISTEDMYVNILQNSSEIGDIEPESAVEAESSFQIVISPDVPDQHMAAIDVVITSGEETWETSFNITINAPVPMITNYVISEDDNNNGILDPGETANLSIAIANNGHADITGISTQLITDNDLISISYFVTEIPSISAGGEELAMYELEADSSIELGTVFTLGMYAQSEYFDFHTSINSSIGFVTEGFESQDFNTFDWQFSGANWLISDDSYAGNFSAQSDDIDDQETTSMSITIDNPSAAEVSFARKVSSENGWDFYKFYINGEEMESLSGEVSWETVSFDIPAGTVELVWEYNKDYVYSSGSDCIWIDEVVFPGVGSLDYPIIFASEDEIDFGQVNIGETEEAMFTIVNFGNETLSGTITTPENFTVSSNRNEVEYEIAAGESQDFMLLFEAEEDGNTEGVVSITSNDQDLEIMVSATLTDYEDDNVSALVTNLAGNYPNPFNPTTSINFAMAEAGKVQIDVYNILGQKVKSLVNNHMEAGNHQVVWNGKDNANSPVASGVYFYKMKTGRYTSTKKMLMLK